MLQKIFYSVIAFWVLCNTATAQTKKELRKQEEKTTAERIKKLKQDAEQGAIVFNKYSALNIGLRNDGYTVGFEKGKFIKMNTTKFWWISLGERKLAKEERVLSRNALINGLGNPYIYGKINNFYLLDVGFGQQRLLGSKSYKNGIAVTLTYGGGLSLGMLKPYYLEVYNKPSRTATEIIKYDDDNNRFIDHFYIAGSAPFGKGFGEMKFVPGLFTKTAVRFDYGKFNDVIAAIEVGVDAQFYTQKMPVMLFTKEKNFFVSSYVSLIFGSRK